MSNTTTAQTLAAAVENVKSAYTAHAESEAPADLTTHYAFRMLTREAVRLLTPRNGLGAARRASRLVRAEQMLAGARAMTETVAVTDYLAAAIAPLGALHDYAQQEVIAKAGEKSEDDDSPWNEHGVPKDPSAWNNA